MFLNMAFRNFIHPGAIKRSPVEKKFVPWVLGGDVRQRVDRRVLTLVNSLSGIAAGEF